MHNVLERISLLRFDHPIFQDGSGEPECILPSNALGGRSTIKQNQSRRDQESHVTSPGFRYNDDIRIVRDYLKSAKEAGGEGGMRSQSGNRGGVSGGGGVKLLRVSALGMELKEQDK